MLDSTNDLKAQAVRRRAEINCPNKKYNCYDVLDEKYAIRVISKCIEETINMSSVEKKDYLSKKVRFHNIKVFL